MSSIIGIINKKGRTLEPALVEKTMVPPVYWEPDDSGIWSRGPVALGCHMLYTTPGSLNEKLPHYHEESGCCITADARIDYREELAEELNLDWKDARNLPDSIFLLKAYQKWGRDCVKHFYGDFAFAIWDDRSQTLFAARDHFGCRPFYYFETEELFAFSSDIMGLMLMPGFSAKIDEMFLVDTLATIVPEKDKTAFETLFRLRPAHMLSIDRDAGLTTVRYWDLELKPAFTGLNETEAAAGLRQRFMKAVGERCRSAFPVGIELSGGLDSSAIACAASGVSNKENSLTAFSHTLSEEQKKHYYPFIDETGYAEIVAGTCHFKDHFRIHGEGSYGCLQVLSDFLDLCPMPYGQGFSLFSDLLYNSARKAGVRVLLSGFGGDEGVTSQAGGFFEELVQAGKLGELKKQLRLKIRKGGGNY
ncbi:MAG TPA: asparagine synthetase B, partial [Desulfobacteraceae bacterium]|nr:asparagine synthetase B [Desulfobacteraceae bacterium]